MGEAPRHHEKAGEEEAAEQEATDLADLVHAKLTTQLESRVRDPMHGFCISIMNAALGVGGTPCKTLKPLTTRTW